MKCICGFDLVKRLKNWELEVKNIGIICVPNVPINYCINCCEEWCDIETDDFLNLAIKEIKNDRYSSKTY